MIEVVPEIFEQEWDRVEEKIRLVASYIDCVQIGVADGTLVPAKTLLDFSQFLGATSNGHALSFEAHLMVADPVKYIRPLVDNGFKRLIAHVESQDPRAFLEQVTFESVETYLAIDGATEFEQLEPFIDEIDGILVMTTEAGETGGVFLPETIEKIKLIRQNYADLPIEAKGGIDDKTAKIVEDAGVTRIVSTQYIFANNGANLAERIKELQNS